MKCTFIASGFDPFRYFIGVPRNGSVATSLKFFIVMMLIALSYSAQAITLQVTANPSACPASGRINFAVDELLPGSPGSAGTPPSVSYYVWTTTPGNMVAGSGSHTSFASAHVTTDISLGGLSARLAEQQYFP